MDTRYKRIEWSYPTSDNATKFGFCTTGCYTVETSTRCGIPVAESGHETLNEALEMVKAYDLEWHPLFVRLRYAWIANPDDEPVVDRIS